MRTLVLALSIFILGFNAAQAQEVAVYRATFTNLTNGQGMTPPALVVHASGFSLFTPGTEASEGLKILAKDGVNVFLETELSSEPGVFVFTSGTEVVPPKGGTSEIFFVGVTNVELSVASMLGSTNDAFVTAHGISLDLQVGEQTEADLAVYDAGAEENNELCAFISGPPCNNHNVDTAGNEGFVHPHPGLAFNGDLDPLVHAFAATAGKVTILRIQ